MGLFSFFSKKSYERVLVIDIGSASVTGAYIIISGGEHPLVQKVATSPIAVLPDIDPIRFEKEMNSALTNVMQMIEALKEPKPDRISVFLSSPWYVSQVRNAKLSRPSSFVVSKKILDDLVMRERKAFDEEIHPGVSAVEPLRSIESKTVRVVLNGYSVQDPINMSAHDVELALYVAASPERILTSIEEAISKIYPHTAVSFTSFLTAAFYTLHSHFEREINCLFVDIGGEITDVTLIRNGAPTQSVSFPKGRNFMLRELANGLGRSIDESVSICTLYVEGKVEESMKVTCEKILTQVKNTWLTEFQKSLFVVSNELSVPDTVFLTCHSDVAPWFVETIRREEFQQYTLTEKEFRVVLLDGQFFHNDLGHADGILRNPFVMIEALFSAQYTHTTTTPHI